MGAYPAHATRSPARTPFRAPVRSGAPSVGHVVFLWRHLKGAGGAFLVFPFFARKVVHVDEAWERGVKTLSVAVASASAAVDRRRHLTKGALWSVSAYDSSR